MNNQDKPIEIAISEDHPLVREKIKSILTRFGFNVILEARDGTELLEEMSKLKSLPDVCLLDINTPRMQGYETAGQITMHYPAVKIAALKVNMETECLLKMLRSGAVSYLIKTGDPQEWKTAIESIVEKGYYFSDWMAKSIFNHFKDN